MRTYSVLYSALFYFFFGADFSAATAFFFGFVFLVSNPNFLNSFSTSACEAPSLMLSFSARGSRWLMLQFFLRVSPSTRTFVLSTTSTTTHFFPASRPAVLMHNRPVSITIVSLVLCLCFRLFSTLCNHHAACACTTENSTERSFRSSLCFAVLMHLVRSSANNGFQHLSTDSPMSLLGFLFLKLIYNPSTRGSSGDSAQGS